MAGTPWRSRSISRTCIATFSSSSRRRARKGRPCWKVFWPQCHTERAFREFNSFGRSGFPFRSKEYTDPASVDYSQVEVPNARWHETHTFTLFPFPTLTEEDMQQIAHAIVKVIKAYSRARNKSGKDMVAEDNHMKNKRRWGVVGSCGIARRRTIPEGIVPAANAKLVGLYDCNQEGNAEAARLWVRRRSRAWKSCWRRKSMPFTSPRRLICTASTGAQCLKAGKHVLCEKPLALSVAEGKEMVALGEGARRYSSARRS